eukprot:3109736-Rhodomonas_salina.2
MECARSGQEVRELSTWNGAATGRVLPDTKRRRAERTHSSRPVSADSRLATAHSCQCACEDDSSQGGA